MRPRVVVVDDDGFSRMSIASVLRLQGFDVVGEAGDASCAVSMVQALDPDVLVTDLDLGSGPSGIDLIGSVRRSDGRLPVVVLTSYTDPRLVPPGLGGLPDDVVYLVKSEVTDATTLIEAVRRAIARKDVPTGRSDTPGRGSTLTDAQIELLRMIAEGLSNAEIARRRRISVKTVEGGINRLAHRLGVTSSSARNHRVELTRIYLRMAGQVDAR